MSSAPDRDGELLSAYLAGELDDSEAAALEARLAAEPQLAARLETTHRLLIGLQGLDEVEPPAGYARRLRARLDAERSVVPLASRRRRVPWPAVAAAAAGVAVVAVAAIAVGPLAPDRAVFDAAEEAAVEPDEDAETVQEAPVDDTTALSRGTAEAPDEEPDIDMPVLDAATGAPAEPVILDEEAWLPDEEAVRARYAALPEAEGLLGMPLADAEAQAASFRFAIQRAAAFASGVHPADCLDVVQAGAGEPVVVVRVESAVHGTDAAVAYVAVTSAADALDRIEAWLVDAATCATRLYVVL